MMNPLPIIAQAFSLVKQEERQRQGAQVPTPFLANVKYGQYNAGKQSANFTQNENKKLVLKCTYCQKEGHIKESCFKLIGYPPKGRGR